MSDNEIGTFKCPICGSSEPHYHDQNLQWKRVPADQLGAEYHAVEGLLHRVMDQCEADFKVVHAEICKLQGIDPATNDWPSWTTIANTKRWFDAIRANLLKPPLKLHFTNEWLKTQIEKDPDIDVEAGGPPKRTDGYGDPAKGEYNAFLADDGSDIPCD